MLVDLPALVHTELGQHEPCWCEAAGTVVERHPHAGVAEADQVAAAVAGQVGYVPRMLVDLPALVQTEVSQHESRGPETVAVGNQPWFAA